MNKLLVLCFALSFSSLLAVTPINWSNPTTLSAANVDASSPLIVMDPSGNATAVWLEGGSTLKASTRPVGGNWSAPTTLSVTASSPQLGVDESGTVTVVWLTTGGILLSATHPPSGSWGLPATISSLGATTPALAVQPNGNVVAVWTRNGRIESATKLSGEILWGSVAILSGTSADFPHVAVGSNGTVVAIWHRVVSSADLIASARAAVGGAWGAETSLFQVGTAALKHNYPKVTVDAGGSATAVWFRYNQSSTDFLNVSLLSSTLPASGSAWSVLPTLVSSGEGVRDPATLPTKIACDANGNVIAIWTFSPNGITFNIESSVKRTSEATWKSPVQLAILDAHAHAGDLSASSAGNALATYMYFDRTSMVIQASESNSAGHVANIWSTPVNLSQGTDNGYPRVASALVGNVYYGAALWLHFDGAHTTLQTSSGSRALLAPPTNVALVQSVTNFGVYQDYRNTISWDPSTDPKVWGYVIYRNGILIACVLKHTLQFVDHNRAQSEVVTYGVSAIDDRFMQSAVVNVSSP